MAVFPIDGWSSSKAANAHEVKMQFGLLPTPQGHSLLNAVAGTDEHIITVQVTAAPEHDTLPNSFKVRGAQET